VINVSTAQTRNAGVGGADASDTGYYFSTDPAGQPAQAFSGTQCNVPALAAGAAYTCTDMPVSVPASLPAGNYYLVAIADHDAIITESNESNNARADSQPIELIDCSNPGPEMCFDSIDNDCDGFVDGADSDCLPACLAQGDACSGDFDCCSQNCKGGRNKSCKGAPVCTPTELPETSCMDGLDNDCDGLTDGSDPDCPSSCEPTQVSESSCSDGLDNDCDGFIDGADPDCAPSCTAKGDACGADADCCSGKCRGPSGNQSCK
jgi:hypothetical protein